MKTRLLILAFILLVSFPLTFAKSGSIKLLAVTETGNNTFAGSIVNMDLDIKEGSGRVFIDSFPLTKLDTQITTRTANRIACDYIGDSCSSHDFFYAVNSSAVTVGGPSAGAATAALTAAVIKGWEINESISITGTINAGSLVGTVGGIREKIKAASREGIKVVLVPFGEKMDGGNNTISLQEYGKGLNITVIEISTLGQALEILTGRKMKEPERNFSISPVYMSTMRNIAERLCNRSTQILVDVLKDSFQKGNILDNSSAEIERESNNLTSRAQDAMQRGAYYSAASYCYGAGLRNIQIMLIERNLSLSYMGDMAENLSAEISRYEAYVDKKEIRTITDLESYLVVKERLYEARKNAEGFNKDFKEGDKEAAMLSLASIISRFNSAKSWAEFYGKPGRKIRMDKNSLTNSCRQKLSEAEERYQYIEYYFPGLIAGLKSDVEEALSNYRSENYAMCLFLATKAKADIDSVSSTIGLNEGMVGLVIEQRLDVAKNVIAEQNSKGMFPILGYSYYEYAIDLKQSNNTGTKATALVYTGYAIELSRLDIYFPKDSFNFKISTRKLLYVFIFTAGFIAGTLVYEGIIALRKRKRKKKVSY